MKRKLSVCIIITSILLFFSFAVGKGIILYGKYPNPQIITYQYGESILVDGYEISFTGWQWGNSKIISSILPDFDIDYTDENGNVYESRVGLITLTITKVSDTDDTIDLANIGFSSGAWGNQFDMALFYGLNPTLNNMVLDLEVGNVQQVILPLILNESHFPQEQWEHIDDRKFYINFQYYPQHIRFECACSGIRVGIMSAWLTRIPHQDL